MHPFNHSKMGKLNIYFKAGMWAMVAEILVRAISFLSTPVFSRILPMDVYGDVKTFESWLSVLSPILSLGLFTNIEIAQYQFKERFRQYVSSLLFLIVVIHGGILCLALLLRSQLCSLLDFTPSMLMVAVFYCCFYSCILCLMRTQRILLQYKQTALLSLLATVPSLLLSVGCCLAAKNVSNTQLLDLRIVSFYTPVILLGVAVTVGFWLRHKSLIRPDYWRYGLKVSVPLIMYQISLQVLTQSDRIMIQQMVSPSAAAIFSIGTTVIYIVEIVHKGLESAWIPWLYQQLDTKKYEQVKKAIFLIMGGFAVLFFYLILMGPEIIFFLGGKNYSEAIWLLGPMLASVAFQFFMLKLADIGKFYQKNNYIAIISIIVSILNLGLNYVGIQLCGYQAAAYTTMLSYTVAVLIYLGLMKAKLPQLKLCYGKMFALCVGIATLMLLMMSFYVVSYWIRYFAAAALTALLFIFFFKSRDKIQQIWRHDNAQ